MIKLTELYYIEFETFIYKNSAYYYKDKWHAYSQI